MFRSIAEDIVFYLSKKKILNHEKREIYTYALEVVLLNFLLLVTLFLISLILRSISYFACYVIFFIPLRIFSGGYHSKKSEICFVTSVMSYTMALFVLKIYPLLYENIPILIITLITMIMVFIFSPVVNINHPLTKIQKRRNRIIVRLLVFIDFTLLIIFYINRMTIASYENIFVILNGVTFLIGKAENYVGGKNYKKGYGDSYEEN